MAVKLREEVIKEEAKKIHENVSFDFKDDKYRLAYHLMPPVGWLNDPNGLCQLNGEYHLYYQYSPTNANGGLKYWGDRKSVV